MRRITPIALMVICSASAAFAVGEADDETPPTPTETTEVCEDGQIYDEETQACVDSDVQSLNDDTRYDAVRELAYAGAYDRALLVIASADAPEDPRFLNYRGFIARKSGDMDNAMTYYQAALTANPDYILARSYMGQGLVSLGKVDAAREQLAEISARGGTGTWAHAELAKAIRGEATSGY